MRTMTSTPRAERLIQAAPRQPLPYVRGYGLSIDFLDGYPIDARIINERSPLLFPEKADLTEGEKGDRRRFCFVKYDGEDRPPRSGLIRHVGDAFFADARTAELVWQAVLEKVDNDARHLELRYSR